MLGMLVDPGRGSNLRCRPEDQVIQGGLRKGLQRIIHFEAIRVTVQFDDPSYELSGDPQLLHCELPTESENWPSGQSLHVGCSSVES